MSIQTVQNILTVVTVFVPVAWFWGLVGYGLVSGFYKAQPTQPAQAQPAQAQPTQVEPCPWTLPLAPSPIVPAKAPVSPVKAPQLCLPPARTLDVAKAASKASGKALTVKQLRAELKARGLRGVSKLRKADLIALYQA